MQNKFQSYHSSLEWLEKASRMSSHFLAGHNEERRIISQPRCGRCHWAGTGQATLAVVGSKQSYALKWCKLNNDNDDDDDDDDESMCSPADHCIKVYLFSTLVSL